MAPAPLIHVRAAFGSAGKPIFMMKIAEVPFAAFLLIQIAQGDIQPHLPIALGGRIKLARRDLQARIKVHRPFNDVTMSAWLHLHRRFHCARLNPFPVGVPSLVVLARLTLKQPATANATEARLRKVHHHLPA